MLTRPPPLPLPLPPRLVQSLDKIRFLSLTDASLLGTGRGLHSFTVELNLSTFGTQP
jgi:hypothetical protein